MSEPMACNWCHGPMVFDLDTWLCPRNCHLAEVRQRAGAAGALAIQDPATSAVESLVGQIAYLLSAVRNGWKLDEGDEGRIDNAISIARVTVSRLLVEDAAATEALRGQVEWLESLKACGNNICAHCKQPFPADEMSAHMMTCDKSRVVAAVSRLVAERDHWKLLGGAEAGRLDVMWQQLVRERDAAVAALATAQADAARNNDRATNAELALASIAAGVDPARIHRGCCGVEHDPERGKIHGFCVICGVPWPCPEAPMVVEALRADAARREGEARAEAFEEAALVVEGTDVVEHGGYCEDSGDDGIATLWAAAEAVRKLAPHPAPGGSAGTGDTNGK